MTDKQLLEQALEALKTCMYPQQKQLQAITAIRARLEQPEQEPVAWISPNGNIHFDPWLDSAPLYAAPPAAPVQEPVAKEPFGYFQYDIRLDAWVQNRINKKGVAFYTKEQK